MKKKKYETLEVDVVLFDKEDVITTSNVGNETDQRWPEDWV